MGRTLHLSNPPMKGPDVLALQTALKAAKLYAGALDSLYGASTAHSCEVAKFRLGYASSQIHPHHETAGATLTAYLQGHKALPLAYKIRRRARLNVPSKEQAARAASVAYWHTFLIPKAGEIDYSEIRPMEYMYDLEHLPVREDCSTACTKDNKAGGLPDPNGLGFDGQGYTGTMLKHLRRIAKHQVQIGDKVVWVDPAEPSGHHVGTVLAIHPDGDMDIGSNGRPTDPRSVLLSVETAAQAAMGATEIHYLAVA